MPKGGTGARWRAPLDNAVADGSCAASDADLAIAAEIRAAGPIRQHVNFLALWVTMQVEQGVNAESRRAVLAALPVLRGAGTP